MKMIPLEKQSKREQRKFHADNTLANQQNFGVR